MSLKQRLVTALKPRDKVNRERGCRSRRLVEPLNRCEALSVGKLKDRAGVTVVTLFPTQSELLQKRMGFHEIEQRDPTDSTPLNLRLIAILVNLSPVELVVQGIFNRVCDQRRREF